MENRQSSFMPGWIRTLWMKIMQRPDFYPIKHYYKGRSKRSLSF